MAEVKQINIKNRTYYFYKDIIDLKGFEPNLLKIGKSSYKNIDIYYIGCITIKTIDNYESIYSVYPLLMCIDHPSERKNENKYLIFDSVDENKVVFENTRMFGMELKTK